MRLRILVPVSRLLGIFKSAYLTQISRSCTVIVPTSQMHVSRTIFPAIAIVAVFWASQIETSNAAKKMDRRGELRTALLLRLLNAFARQNSNLCSQCQAHDFIRTFCKKSGQRQSMHCWCAGESGCKCDEARVHNGENL